MRAEAGNIHGLLQELSQIYFGLNASWHSFTRAIANNNFAICNRQHHNIGRQDGRVVCVYVLVSISTKLTLKTRLAATEKAI